ncbi:MAG: DUF262 domain-containing protein [Nocardioides sp.]
MAEAQDDTEISSEYLDRTLTGDEIDDLVAREDSPPEITYSTQDFTVDALVTRMERSAMRVPSFGKDDPAQRTAGFQRSFVWTKAQMDRFIESLLLGYPVPGIFLVKQADNVMLILDGQQRLETLRRFYSGVYDDKVFKLDNVGESYRGRTYKALDESSKLGLDDSYMHATIVATDGSNEVNEAIYGIFERLNSGGTQLTAHEIRVALSAGPVMVAVERLNSIVAWRALYGPKNKRIRDHELVLRIIALYLDAENYSRPLKQFLNAFSLKHRSATTLPASTEPLFEEAAQILEQQVGRKAFRRKEGSQVNSAQAEAVMVGLMRILADPTRSVSSKLADAIERLQDDPDFARATTRATADNDAVMDRLEAATRLLGA